MFRLTGYSLCSTDPPASLATQHPTGYLRWCCVLALVLLAVLPAATAVATVVHDKGLPSAVSDPRLRAALPRHLPRGTTLQADQARLPVPSPRQTAGFAANELTAHWTNMFPDLNEISAVSSQEAWTVGEYGHLLHWTNGTWTAVDPPALRGANLQDIAMPAPTVGWITAGSQAFQYDGTTWQERSTGLGVATNLTVERVAALTPNDVWATAFQPNGPVPYTLAHWDGTRWRAAGPALSLRDCKRITFQGILGSAYEEVITHG